MDRLDVAEKAAQPRASFVLGLSLPVLRSDQSGRACTLWSRMETKSRGPAVASEGYSRPTDGQEPCPHHPAKPKPGLPQILLLSRAQTTSQSSPLDRAVLLGAVNCGPRRRHRCHLS